MGRTLFARELRTLDQLSKAFRPLDRGGVNSSGSLPPKWIARDPRDGRGQSAAAKAVVGLTAKALSCAARAHVDGAERRAACLHVSRAMQAA